MQSVQTGEITLRHIELLDSLQVDGILHLGRPLKEHLVGTCQLLANWGSPSDVCVAGLFHSIYGTQTFRSAALATDSRDELRATIGEYAERLVYVFGMSDRQRLLLDNPCAPYVWINRDTGTSHTLSGDVYRHLVSIEVANFIEQVPFLTERPLAALRDMRDRFDAAARHMPACARRAYRYAVRDGMRKYSASAQRRPEEPR